MTRWIFRSVTLCNRWVAGIHPPQEKGTEDAPRGLQWDFSNYLLLHIWMRWATRGLEACAALLPSENHLRSDFKNIPVMLQDKSLITGNYGSPILLPLHPFSPGPPLLAQTPHPLCIVLPTFIPSFNRRSSLGRERETGLEKRNGGRGGRVLLPGSRHWSWPLSLYCTSIHVEWLTCGHQLRTKWSKLGLVMKRLDWLSDWLSYSYLLVFMVLSFAFEQSVASASGHIWVLMHSA